MLKKERRSLRGLVRGIVRPGSDELAHVSRQWRKCRIPVKTIASPASSAAAMTSLSRMETPGWITAVAPAYTAASNPSTNGKKASDGTAEPTVRASFQPALSYASLAFQAEMRANSRGLTEAAQEPEENTHQLHQ